MTSTLNQGLAVQKYVHPNTKSNEMTAWTRNKVFDVSDDKLEQ